MLEFDLEGTSLGSNSFPQSKSQNRTGSKVRKLVFPEKHSSKFLDFDNNEIIWPARNR